MPGDDGITSAEGRLLAVQMGALRDDVRDVKDTMREMAKSLEQLVRIEEQQKDMRAAISRAFDEIKIERRKREEVESRVTTIEQAMPGMRELRNWVVGGVIGSLTMLTSAIVYYLQNHLK